MDFSKVFRMADGDRCDVLVTMRSEVQGDRMTVDGDRLPYGFVSVSFTGERAPWGVRFGTNASSYGQVRPGLEDDPALSRAWARWHLNGSRAGCRHQGGPSREIGEVCPFDGYRYGSAWLIDPLTLDGALDIVRVMDAPASVTVLAHDDVAVGVFSSMQKALAHLQETVSYSWDHAIRNEGWSVGNVLGVPQLAMA